MFLGSGCGSDGRAIAYNTRDPRFKFRHRQNFIYQLYIRKNKNKEKEAGNVPSLKKSVGYSNRLESGRLVKVL